jgi:hypothetical protein
MSSESWASYISKRKDAGIGSMDVESTMRALESISNQDSDPLEAKLAWMSPDASMFIRREISKENSSCASVARKASVIVNHYLNRKEINKSSANILSNGDHDQSQNSNNSEILPLDSMDSLQPSENYYFTNPHIQVSMCELFEPSLATTWLPGLNVSTGYEHMNGQLKDSTTQQNPVAASICDDIQNITLDELKGDLYDLMVQTMIDGRLVASFPRRLQHNRQKLMNCSSEEWCFLLPSACLFQISTKKILSSCEPMRNISSGISVLISTLGTLCPSKNCGRHIVSSLIPTVLQSISTLDSNVFSNDRCYYSELCIKISNDIIYKYSLGSESKSNLLRLLEGIRSSNLEFASCLWLEISKLYYEYNR